MKARKIRTGILENLGEVITILVSRVPRSSGRSREGIQRLRGLQTVNSGSLLSAKHLSLRARNSGLHLVRVRAFCAAPIESGRHVKIGFSRLHAAIAIRSAHNQCRIDLGVRSTRNAATIDVVTRDPAGAASAPGELDLMPRGGDASAGQSFN